jgi:hypothetical protein
VNALAERLDSRNPALFRLNFGMRERGERRDSFGALTVLAHYHDDLALAAAIELAKEDSLPAPEQQLAILERYGD